jgi:hypothetical protein
MPAPIRQECSSFIATYGPIIIELFVQQVQPDKVCRTIGLCPKLIEPRQKMMSDEVEFFKAKSNQLAIEQLNNSKLSTPIT